MARTLGVSVGCDVVPETLTVEQAHAIMQAHLACSTERCQRRGAALALLVATGRYKIHRPDRNG